MTEEKIKELEDIEQEIRIDLITLFKALKSHIYVKNTQGIRCEGYWSKACLTFGFHEVQGWFFTYKARGCPIFFIKDYGKTWALRKEELEK